MADTYDVDFDVALARNWKADVENELAQVKKVLMHVATECQTNPGEDDTIMQGIQAVGDALNAAWTGIFDGFQKIFDFFADLITGRERGINESVDAWQEVQDSYHN